MIKLLLLLSLSLLVHAMEYSSNNALKYESYDSYKNEIVFEGDTKFKLQNEAFTTNLTLEYLYSSEYKQRRYLMLNELYLTKEYEDYSFVFGKIIKFLGELEGFNIADVFNQKNYLFDPFDKSAKLGSYSLFATKYFDENSLEIGVKFYEEAQKYPTGNTPYAPFKMNYDETLEVSDKAYTPTLYLTYALSNAKLMFVHGYDNKRYFAVQNQTTLTQYAYRVNKLLLTSNLLYKDVIFKLESSYTDVISDKNMGDYAQISAGIEKSFYDIYGVDMGLYAEYYRYIYLQDSIKNVDISEIYDNDVFVALKLNFNDVGASEIKSGLLHDVKNQEEVFKIEAKTRVRDMFVIEAQYLQTMPKENTLLWAIGATKRFTFALNYAF